MSLGQLILDTLEDMGDEDFENFKWHLEQPDQANGLRGIARSKIESAKERTKITDLILEVYHGSEAQVMVAVLKKMDKNNLVLRFTNISKEASRDVVPPSVGLSQHQSLQPPSTPIGSAVSAGNLPPEPQTRREFLQYACPLSLNQNTVHNWVSLSAENRKVTFTDQESQSYHADPRRFDVYTQVLCNEALEGGRYYWEVQWSGHVVVAVSYDDIPREGLESLFGANAKSWGLICSDTGFALKHNKRETTVCGPRPSRVVGVYLDHPAGTVSFYSVSFDGVAPAKMMLIHKVTLDAPFKKALHPGIGPFRVGSSGELCEIW